MVDVAFAMFVHVAQLDRASGYGPEGRGFESFHARKRRFISSLFSVIIISCE